MSKKQISVTTKVNVPSEIYVAFDATGHVLAAHEDPALAFPVDPLISFGPVRAAACLLRYRLVEDDK